MKSKTLPRKSYAINAVKILLFIFSLSASTSLVAQIINPQTVIGAGAVAAGLLLHKKNKNPKSQNNTASTKENPLLYKTPGSYTSANVTDITGVWEGEAGNHNTEWYYKLCVTKLADNTYAGVDSFYLERNSNGTPVQQVFHSQQAFTAKYDNSVLAYDWVQNTPGNNFTVLTEQLRFVNDDNNIAVVNGNASQPNRFIYLKKISNDFPAEDNQFILGENTLQIINPDFKNSENKETLKFNDQGLLTLSLKNNSVFDLNNVKGQITTTESDNGIIDYDKLYSIFNILQKTDNALPLTIHLNSNFSVPPGGLHLNVTFTYNSVVLAKKTLEIPTTSFFNTTTITAPAYASERLKAIGNYYGFSGTPYNEVSKSLDPLITNGDKMASMWKAVFLSTGRNQYKFDENNAYTIAKNNLSFIENNARNGDAEALYLLFYACQMGLEGDNAQTLSYDFLEKSASSGFTPAMLDAALSSYKQRDYITAFKAFQDLYNKGLKVTANAIGIMYEEGYGVNKDVNEAIEWYQKGIAFGDPEAMLSLANIYASGFENTPPDITKAMSLATQAAAKNCSDAMVFLGTKYFTGKEGIAKNTASAIKWFKQGADMGDRRAMLALSEVYFSNDGSVTRDEQSGLFWLKKAAELGSPKAMMKLAQIYSENDKADVIASRYWYNQAVINGYAQADATALNATKQSFLDFIGNADFSPSYVYVDEYGDEVGDSGDGLFNGLFSGLFSAMGSYYGNHQQLIDGLEYICKKDGYKIYGGTVSSHFVSNLYLKPGQTVYIKAYGTVSTGMFSGMANADGLGTSWQEYAVIKGIPCSSVIAAVNNTDWKLIGQSGSYTSQNDGAICFALNAIDFANYKGYFDLVVKVPDN